MSSSINNPSSPQVFYPQVSTLRGDQNSGGSLKKSNGVSEFDQIFEKVSDQKVSKESGKLADNLAQSEKLGKLGSLGLPSIPGLVKEPLKFSAHASQRLHERNIRLDQATLGKVSEAVDKADTKGVEDTLVLTKDAALIVNVKNRTVITAMDRGSLTGNVFTNIDGAVIV